MTYDIPFDRLINRPMSFEYGHPPAIPPLPPLKNNQIENYYYLILHNLLKELNTFQNNTSAAKIYLLNQMSQNGYNNSHFAELTSYTVRLLDSLPFNAVIDDRVINEIIIQKAIPHIGSKNAIQNNYLMAALPQMLQSQVGSTYNEYLLTLQSINSVNNNYAYSAPYQQTQQIYNAPVQHFNHDSFPVNPNPHNNHYQSVFHSNVNNAPVPVLSRPTQTSNRFNIQDQLPVNNTSQNFLTSPGTVSKYDAFHFNVISNNQPPVQKLPDAHFSSTASTPNQVKTIPETSNNIQVPINLMQDIPLAYDPNTYITNTKGEVVNQNDHFKIPSYSSSTPPVHSDDSKIRVYGLNSQISEINKDVKLIPQFSLQENNGSEYLDLSIQDIIYRTDAELKTSSTDNGSITLARNIGMVVTPLFTKGNHQPFIDELCLCDDLTEVANKLKKAINDVNNKTATNVDKTTIAFINKRLTTLFNEMLRNEFSESVQIESFIADLQDAIKYLETLGDQTVKSFVSKEKSFIANSLFYLPESTAAQFSETYNFGKGVNAIYFGTDISVTCVDLYSEELKIDLPVTNRACGVSSSKTPLFHTLAENCIMHKRLYNLHRFKCYIKTLDDVVYEVNEGALNKDFYLVSIKFK